jgi:hypothetical protein
MARVLHTTGNNVTTVAFKLGGTLEILTEPSKAGCFVTLRFGAFSITARGEDMAYTLASGMQVHLKVSYVDAAGNPAAVDGPVSWSSSDIAIATVTTESDTTALVKAVGPVGQVQVSATADVDLGTGVKELITPMDLTVAAGEAVAGTIEPVGPAEPIP